ncbi:MAG: chromosome segregation protein SMC [Anaerolineae bacterium]|nr:chromosome segregation protein SMC [Anaerolineae bacterium]
MRLKHLDLQGFKTFASRTEFAFDGGITAIVGPNGSGKSNIADAIRWVLGEQSYRSLRAKRTEDMIFFGSSARARQGMATASLMLDNADGWLPIDFSEVKITRRAYRSGENEYLLNGSRVRLRDISELLAKSGLARRTYTVVGQGLVDDVLSLRAEDRRALFEEASGITLYQSKRAEAISRLEETRANLVRINDIVNEVAPRLRRLEREAERAEHHALLTKQLDGLLRTWYGYRWREEQLGLQRTQDALNRREVSLAKRRQALETLDDAVATLRDQHAHLRKQLGDWHRERAELRQRLEGVQRDLAVLRERARLLARQQDELRSELAGLEAQAQVVDERASAAQGELVRAQAMLREKEDLVRGAQAGLDAHEAQRKELSQALAQAQSRLLELATRMADRRNRLDQIDERREAQAQERAALEASLHSQRTEEERLRARIAGLAAEQARLASEAGSLQAEAGQLEATLAENGDRRAALEGDLAEARRQLERYEARYDLLSRLRAEGEGLHAGVRAVLRAAAARALAGILGTVAQHMQVPGEYEVAIEVALAGHVQDLIVESWADAERAIAFLREGQRGRATFLPLDTVRPASRLQVPGGEGVIGLASDLVEAEPRLAAVLDMLLARTVVVRDLPAARRVFDRLRGGFQIVTLSGEVLRSSGTVTGGEGQKQAQGQVLAREREWRELPNVIRQARARHSDVEEALAEAQATAAGLRARLAEIQARHGEKTEAINGVQVRKRDLEQELALAGQQLTMQESQMAQLDEEGVELSRRESALHADLEQMQAGRGSEEERVAALQGQLDALSGDALYRRLSEARTSEAVARGAWEHHRATLEGLQEQQGQLRTQVQAKRQRLADLEAEQTTLGEQIHNRVSRESVIQGWLASLAQKIEPAEAELGQLDEDREELEAEEVTLRARLRQAEASHGQAVLAHGRQEDRLERLRTQILDDFGLVEMEPTLGLAEQRLLPLNGMVSALRAVQAVPEGLEQEIHQIKAQLRRMGPVNPSAPEEYGEVLDRHTFLTAQAADLEEAARGLREVISELDDVMRREFLATFESVASRFRQNFTELFGGGTAHLELTDPEDISSTGVEIVARPPGKRQQALALLSGGERSLTAVALIFAILEVSPPPFCVLDEVDAMLDEANIRRFRRALEQLGERTQFIIITHNRGTIQAADLIYGVSMGDDSVSQVISLRLDGDRIASADGKAMDVLKDG